MKIIMGRVVIGLFALFISLYADEMEQLNSGIGTLSDKIVRQMQKHQVKLIAMGDFDNSNGKTQFERNIEIGLVNSIVSKNLDNVSVIERKNLAEVLKEQKLGTTGLLSKKTRVTLGEILGVEALVTAETTVLKRKVTVNVRMYAISTGRILAAPSYTFLRSETIDELLEQDSFEDSIEISRTIPSPKRMVKSKPYKQEESTCFSNNYIQGCSKISRSKDKKRVTVTTTLINHSEHDIYLGQITTCYDTRDGYCSNDKSDKSEYSIINSELVADGHIYGATRTNGITTFFRRWIDRNKISIDNLTALNKKSKISLNYSFLSQKEEIQGNYFDFSSEAVMYYPSNKDKSLKKQKITISGTNLYIPSPK